MPRHPDIPDALATNVTQWLCPESEIGRTHHMSPLGGNGMTCAYCMKSRHDIETDNLAEDAEGRDSRIHGLVLDGANPARTLRELLRQWMTVEKKRSEQPGYNVAEAGDLITRTYAALEQVDVDGHVS